MPMTPPTPHRISSTRITYSNGETYTAPAAVLAEEPALIAPYPNSYPMETFMGPADSSKYLLFVGYDADVKLGDEITNDVSGIKYAVIETPVHYENPQTFQPDHQQIVIQIVPIS